MKMCLIVLLAAAAMSSQVFAQSSNQSGSPIAISRTSKDLRLFRQLLNLTPVQDSSMGKIFSEYYQRLQEINSMREVEQRKNLLLELTKKRDEMVSMFLNGDQFVLYQRHLDSLSKLAVSRYHQ